MKRLLILSLFSLLFISCTSQLVNYALEKKGVFEEQVPLKTLHLNEKEIVFFPMHHIGTKEFYTDVHQKIDSLNQKGYYFFTEYVTMETPNLEEQMKFRKVLGIGIPQGGYEKLFDSILQVKNIKLKRPIEYQPTYTEWNLDHKNSKNVDANLTELVQYYEAKYGEIKLEPCDYDVQDITSSTRCKTKINNKTALNDLIKTYRNELIVKNLQQESKQKIALIYGADHYPGVKSILDSLNHQSTH